MSGEAIEIEYQLTVDDYAKFSADRHLQSGQMRKSKAVFIKIYIFVLILIFFTTLINIFIEYSKDHLIDSDIYSNIFSFVFCVSAFTYVLLSITNKKKRHKSLSLCMKSMLSEGENKAWFSPGKYTLSEYAIFQSSDYLKSEYKWVGVEKIQIMDGDFCLFISAIYALYIPARFFKSEEEKLRVYEQCLKWWQAAREKPAESEAA